MLRSSLVALGLAALLAAAPSVLFVPLHAASAAPASARDASVVAQQPEDPSGSTPSQDPDDAPWPGDEDNDNTPPPNQPNPPVDQGVQGGDQNTPAPATPEAGETKGVVAEPDSTLKAKTGVPQAGGGALDTLQLRPAGAGTRRPALGAREARVEPKPFFGLHPAVFFLGFLVGHVLIVRAVTH